MKSARSIFWTAVKFLVPVGIITLLLLGIEPERWEVLANHPKDYLTLTLALLVALLAIAVSFSRWWLLVRCQGIELSLLEANRLGAICFLLNFASPGSVGGDLFKAVFLAKRRPGRRVQAVASVAVDRGVGLYGLLLVATLSFLLHPGQLSDGPDGDSLRFVKTAAAVLLIVGTFGLAVLAFGGHAVDRWVTHGQRIPVVGGMIARIGPPLRLFCEHRLGLLAALALGVTVHLLLTASIFLIARSLYPEVPTLMEHFIIVPIGMLASAIPLTPGGLGLFEAAMEWLYEFVPSEPTEASGALVALVFEVVKVIIAIAGTLFFWTASDEVKRGLEAAGASKSEGEAYNP